ncbi:MAG: hypothetical protein MJZ11_12815 [Lachnospiraceae bacterium]|nr:hypothetical protein [Lachnospiraceae bacterium]
MANSNATQLKINLQDSLNLNTNKAEISDFAGFNRRNAPFFNGGLSPLFKQEKTGSVIDKMGNIYSVKLVDPENPNSKLGFYKNDILLNQGFEKQSFYKEELNFNLPEDVKFCIDSDMNLFSARLLTGTTGEITYGTKVQNVTLYQNYKVGYLRSLRPSTAIYPKDEILQGLLYCITWNGNEGILYTVMESDSFPSVDVTPFTVTIPEGFETVEDLIISYVYAPFSYNGTNTNGFQIRVEFFDTTDVVKKSKSYPIVVFAPASNYQYLFGGNIAVLNFSNTDELYIREHDTNVYSGKFGTTYKEKGTLKPVITRSGGVVSGTVQYTATSTRTLTGTYDNKNNFVIADGNVVFCNGIATIGTKEVTVSATNGITKYGEGCNAAVDDVYSSFSKNMRIVSEKDGFAILYNNNVVSGISYNGTLLTPFIDIDGNYGEAIKRVCVNKAYNNKGIFETKLALIYKEKNTKKWFLLYRNYNTDIELSLVANRYIVMNTVGVYNAFDTKKQLFVHLFYDFNNSLEFGIPVGSGEMFEEGIAETFVGVSSGINVNYEILQNDNISAIFNPQILTCAINNTELSWGGIALTITNDYFFKSTDKKFITDYIENTNAESIKLDLYFIKNIENGNPVYIWSKNLYNGGNRFILGYFNRPELKDVVYPVTTDGNIILTPSLYSVFFDSQIGADYIKDNYYYNLIYYEGFPLLAYYYGSGVTNAEARFVIQGQSFVIRNGLIYSTTYNNGLMYVNNAIVNVDDLQFIGCLPLAAFFFSPATKCVLAFTGDRNLSTAFEATELKAVLNYKYAPNDNSLYLATEDAVYVLFNTPDGTSFVYKIEEQNVTDFVPQDNGCIALKTGNTWKIFSFYERPDFVRVPLKLTTKFFGAGLNRVSTVDCWYIRAFSEKAEKGKIKVKVQTLTNKSCTSEEQEFLINKEDWDANNGFIYLRYQPKLQRSVGVSLELESDFSIYDIQASIKADSTIQITSEKGF